MAGSRPNLPHLARRARRRSFTLLELLAVIGIVLALSSLTAVSVSAVIRDANRSSATNTVVSVLGIARAVALRDNAYVAVTFRIAADRQTRAIPSDPQVVEVVVAKWTGEVVSENTPGAAAIGFPDDIFADRLLPVPNIPVRRLPPGILVAGPAFSFVTDSRVGQNDRFWRSPPVLAGTVTPPGDNGRPGFTPDLARTELGWGIAVLFGPDGRALSRNPEQVLEVVNSADGNQNAYVKAFLDVDGNGLPNRGSTNVYGNGPVNVDFFVYDEPLDEPLLDLVPYLAVFSDSDARSAFRPEDVARWRGTGTAGVGGPGSPSRRVENQSDFIEEQSDRIVFNRYSGVAVVVPQ
jgi:type II secretory pathway pseudopilin PulG